MDRRGATGVRFVRLCLTPKVCNARPQTPYPLSAQLRALRSSDRFALRFMASIQLFNRSLLRTLMSRDAADIVADRIEELEADAGKLRTENNCLKQDLAECRHLMRKALPTIDSRETDYADDFRAACEANTASETRPAPQPTREST